MPPIDLQPTEADTAAFAAMQAEQPIPDAPQPDPAPAPDPAPEPEPQPEPKSDAAPEPVADEPASEEKPARQVDLRALLEERGKRKEMQARYEEAQAELARLRGLSQQPPQRQEEQPRADTDPIAVIERMDRELAELKQGRQQEAQMTEFQRTVIAKEAEYIRDNPDYAKQVEYLKESRVRELREGLGLNDQQIGQELARQAAETAAYALQHDLNPAEVFSRLALARGWKAEAAPVADPKPAPAQRLATIAAGQKVAKGLSGAGGGAPSAAPTLASIAAMNGAEFDEMWKKGVVKGLMA